MDSKLRSEEAARLLSNNVLLEALEALQKETVAKWSACPARDTEGREWLWMFYQANLSFSDILKGYLATGKIEEFNKKQEGFINKVTSIFKR